VIKITVNGIPAPQGSKNVNKHGAVYESSKKVAPWREAVRAETQRAMRDQGLQLITGPVEVRIGFRLTRPRDHYRTGANSHLLKSSAPAYPCGQRDDIDKLARAVLDGLKAGGAYTDDGHVVTLAAAKGYALQAGADIEVCEVTG
jgi:crossover junction endodeoxyribonuclease RusA